ncbi:MAG: NfeD family protein [Bacteroidetes bacterium]|nr:NfeD family protein [Bacteroidota bacterium]MBK8876362.1 NfeD family protein [Bacteroidota bacterium]MBK9423534.1 NfeD family protein [Bacteroidota bacterium]MBL0071202.1 NfeD family protein [Bacteroidota bacterium]
MVLIIGLIVIGIVLLVLEILVLPGLIAGIIGGIFLFIAIIWMYSSQGDTAGHITLVSTFVVTAAAIYWSLKSRMWNRFGLKDTIDSKVNDVASLHIPVGAEGLTVSALRPSGTIVIENQKVEAQSNGELIDAGTKVIVLESLPNKVIVKTKVTPL